MVALAFALLLAQPAPAATPAPGDFTRVPTPQLQHRLMDLESRITTLKLARAAAAHAQPGPARPPPGRLAMLPEDERERVADLRSEIAQEMEAQRNDIKAELDRRAKAGEKIEPIEPAPGSREAAASQQAAQIDRSIEEQRLRDRDLELAAGVTSPTAPAPAAAPREGAPLPSAPPTTSDFGLGVMGFAIAAALVGAAWFFLRRRPTA